MWSNSLVCNPKVHYLAHMSTTGLHREPMESSLHQYCFVWIIWILSFPVYTMFLSFRIRGFSFAFISHLSNNIYTSSNTMDILKEKQILRAPMNVFKFIVLTSGCWKLERGRFQTRFSACRNYLQSSVREIFEKWIWVPGVFHSIINNKSPCC